MLPQLSKQKGFMAPKRQQPAAAAKSDEGEEGYHTETSHLTSMSSTSEDADDRRRSGRLTRSARVDYRGLAGEGEESPTKVLNKETPKIKLNVSTKQAESRYSDKSKTKTRITEEGTMEYRESVNSDWVPAAYHSDYRRHFIDEDAPEDDSNWQQTQGLDADDQTSYKPSQQHWSEDHLDRIVDSAGRKVLFDDDRPKAEKPRTGNWIHDGKVLLDQNDRPIKAWSVLNRTISSQIAGWHLEAIRRLYWWITMTDIMARMPRFTQEVTGEFRPLSGVSCFTNRAGRFRNTSGIMTSRMRREDTKTVKQAQKKRQKAGVQSSEELQRYAMQKMEKFNKMKWKRKQVEREASPLSSENDNNIVPLLSNKGKRKWGNATELEAELESAILPTKRRRLRNSLAPNQPLPSLSSSSLSSLDSQNSSERLNHSSRHDEGLHVESNEEILTDSDEKSDDDALRRIPLFTSIPCETLAGIQAGRDITPKEIIQEKLKGNALFIDVDVLWYPENTARAIDERNIVHEDVVHTLLADFGEEDYQETGSIDEKDVPEDHQSQKRQNAPATTPASEAREEGERSRSEITDTPAQSGDIQSESHDGDIPRKSEEPDVASLPLDVRLIQQIEEKGLDAKEVRSTLLAQAVARRQSQQDPIPDPGADTQQLEQL